MTKLTFEQYCNLRRAIALNPVRSWSDLRVLVRMVKNGSEFGIYSGVQA